MTERRRRLSRYDLLICDALRALSTSVEPITCLLITHYVSPRVWRIERWGLYQQLWSALDRLVREGWIVRRRETFGDKVMWTYRFADRSVARGQ